MYRKATLSDILLACYILCLQPIYLDILSLQISLSHHLSHGCVQEQRSLPGDQIAVHFQQLDDNGSLVNSTQEGEPFTFILGAGEAPEGWDEGLRDLCAGEIIELVVSAEADTNTYVITVEVITRTVAVPGRRNGKDILVRRGRKCRDAKLVKLGDTVTLKTVARLPNCKRLSQYALYLVIFRPVPGLPSSYREHTNQDQDERDPWGQD